MGLLREKRAELIRRGRAAAVWIAQQQGYVTSRDVRAALEQYGFLTDPTIADYWLGAVFNGGPLEWRGEWFKYTDQRRNIHERTVKVWRLPS